MRSRKQVSVGVLMAAVGLAFTADMAAALPRVERLEGGGAVIQNSEGTSFREVHLDDLIGLDEAVLPSPQTRLLVRCPNNTRRRVIPGRWSGIGLICPDLGVVRRSRNENDLLLLNSGVFPYVLRVAEQSPTLSWPELLGVGRYQVSVYRLEQDELGDRLWQTETAATRIDYGGPPLELGRSYGLIVEPVTTDPPEQRCGEGVTEQAASGVARWRRGDCFRADLRRLDPEPVEQLTAAAAALEATVVDEVTGLLALAYRYAESGGYGDVIGLVEPLAARGEQSAAVYQLLGDGYLRSGWFEQAQAAYEAAQRLATESGDYRTRLEAKLGLAKVAAWRMQSEQAVDYLWSALGDVSYVRDPAQADVIVQWLNRLQ